MHSLYFMQMLQSHLSRIMLSSCISLLATFSSCKDTGRAVSPGNWWDFLEATAFRKVFPSLRKARLCPLNPHLCLKYFTKSPKISHKTLENWPLALPTSLIDGFPPFKLGKIYNLPGNETKTSRLAIEEFYVTKAETRDLSTGFSAQITQFLPSWSIGDHDQHTPRSLELPMAQK